jgi:hypothetical protein
MAALVQWRRSRRGSPTPQCPGSTAPPCHATAQPAPRTATMSARVPTDGRGRRSTAPPGPCRLSQGPASGGAAPASAAGPSTHTTASHTRPSSAAPPAWLAPPWPAAAAAR